MNTATQALARNVNVKHRQFDRADNAAYRSPYNDAAGSRRRAALTAWTDATRLPDVWDYADGEHFSVTDEAGTHLFAYTAKGDPRFIETTTTEV